jgi:hypothetical protein
MDWARILAFVTGVVDQELLARNEYLAAENRILKAKLKGRLQLSNAERATLGEIGHRLGRKVLGEVANVAQPDTILAWYRKLVARKFDGSKARRSPGRPRIKGEVEHLIVRMAKENGDWGYDRIAGALANLGYKICDQTIGNVLRRHALPPAPERKRTTTWPAFIRIHLALLAGTDFFTTEVLTLRGLVTYYVLFFIRLESRRVDIAGVTVHPDERWMRQIARNVTMEGCGALPHARPRMGAPDLRGLEGCEQLVGRPRRIGLSVWHAGKVGGKLSADARPEDRHHYVAGDRVRDLRLEALVGFIETLLPEHGLEPNKPFIFAVELGGHCLHAAALGRHILRRGHEDRDFAHRHVRHGLHGEGA